MEEVGIDVDKVKSYVSAYTFVEMEKEEPDEKTNYIAEARAAYSPSKVTAYTDRYWNSHNSAYPNFENMVVTVQILCRKHYVQAENQ